MVLLVLGIKLYKESEMGPVLHGLIKLQSVENGMRTVKSKLTRCRRSVIFQENQIRTMRNGLAAKEEEIKLARVQIDRLELDLKSKDEHIAKYRAALNLAKTNKEYSSILTELNTSKADNTKVETHILELMKNIEADEENCTATLQKIEDQSKHLDELRKKTDVEAAKHEKEIAEIQKDWDEAAKDIPGETLEIFNRVAETYDGEAIAEVGKQDDRNDIYSCGGCFMRVPAETTNTLMTKDDIVRCPNCTRILVYKDSV